MLRTMLCWAGAQQIEQRLAAHVAQFRPAHHQVEQIIIRVIEQFPEILQLLRIQCLQMTVEKISQHQIQLQQSAPALPADAV